jgi:oxygen-dependent protoporphyrinogen oxidase
MFIILGAGISGLTLGYEFKKANQPFLILEKGGRTGGWIQTDTSSGFIFENGPRSFRTVQSGSETLDLIHELNLQDELILANPAAKKRLLYHKGALRTFKPWNRPILKAIWKDLITGSSTADDESVEHFFARRFGSDISECFGDAVVSGIFAGDYTKLSMKSCFPKFWDWDQKHRGMIRGMLKNRGNKTGIFSFKNGMQTLTDRLTEILKDDIRTNTEAIALRQTNNGIIVTTSNQEQISAERVFSTINPLQLAPLLSQSVAKQLWKIPSASVGIVHMGFKKEILEHKGFGYLIPHCENESIIGVVWDSCTFPQQNRHPQETRMSVMFGGMRQKNLLDLSQDAMQDLALEALKKQLHLKDIPDFTSAKVARNAIPQYELNHESKLHTIGQLVTEQLPGMTLLGNGYKGVSIHDCILNGRTVGRNGQTVWR